MALFSFEAIIEGVVFLLELLKYPSSNILITPLKYSMEWSLLVKKDILFGEVSNRLMGIMKTMSRLRIKIKAATTMTLDKIEMEPIPMATKLSGGSYSFKV